MSDDRFTTTTLRVARIYEGSNGEATRGLYDELQALGPIGFVALNLFRACKTSERAKAYRRRAHSAEAYQRKQWSMDNLAGSLLEHGTTLGIAWGWGLDEKQPLHRFVLYVDLPTGQVSFHTEHRGVGPDYAKQWDGAPGAGAARICSWVAHLLERKEAA